MYYVDLISCKTNYFVRNLLGLRPSRSSSKAAIRKTSRRSTVACRHRVLPTTVKVRWQTFMQWNRGHQRLLPSSMRLCANLWTPFIRLVITGLTRTAQIEHCHINKPYRVHFRLDLQLAYLGRHKIISDDLPHACLYYRYIQVNLNFIVQ